MCAVPGEMVPSSRREWLKQATAICGGSALAWGSVPLLGQNGISAVPPSGPQPGNPPLPRTRLQRFPRMVQEYFVEQVRQAELLGELRRARLQTRADAEAYVAHVRGAIRECFGPEPERTPLQPRVTGVLERPDYTVEKVIFESRPKFLVTANLYIPKHRTGKLPGVVASCGHSRTGKCEPAYQAFAQTLARMGYMLLIFDPIGQGERIQYLDEHLHPRRGVGVPEHLHGGNQQFLVGDFFGSWRAWDAIRALDFLLTHPRIDPRHVGITGNSGGGTMTTWLAGLDRRWTMAAPGCFVTTFRRNLENELPADTEQCPPGVLAAGLDHSDFLAAMAPRPVILLAKERDFFDVRGAIEAHRRLERLYALLGKPENLRLHIGPTDHGYSVENREAMYRFFNEQTRASQLVAEPAVVIEPQEALWCTPRGQVADLKSRTLFSWTREKSETLAAARRKKTPEKTGASENSLQQQVELALRLPALPALPPEYRILRPLTNLDYPRPHATHYAVNTEASIFAIVTRLSGSAHYSRPPQAKGPAVLYLAHNSSDLELRDVPLLRKLAAAQPEVELFACDVRGLGESQPNTCGDVPFNAPYGPDYFYAAHALMLNRPYLGQRVYDVLRVMQWLESFQRGPIEIIGKGWSSLTATFAALCSPRISQVTLIDAPESFAKFAETEEYACPLSAMLPGVLQEFDLPECYAFLKSAGRLKVARAN